MRVQQSCVTAGAAACLALTLAAAHPAVAQERRRFDIPAQPADAALRALAAQLDRQIVFPFATVAGRSSKALSGAYTPEEAVARLAGSVGLIVRSNDGRTISLAAAPSLRAAAEPAPVDQPPVARSITQASAPVPLGEVVVTATRRSELLALVPVAVTALPQSALDERGVRLLADMHGATPSLDITGPGGAALAYASIRGVQSSGVGVAATAGIYLDDTPLHKRNAGGGSTQGYSNGAPIPPLFDLDRIEVLRGPQGTLFGSASEGGTIRFITPSPNLSRFEGYARAEVSTLKYGAPTAEAGFGFGGPIVKDRLAFRATLWARESGGWIDLVDRFSREEKDKNANGGEARLARVTAVFAPRSDARLTLAYLTSRERSDDVVPNTSLSIDTPIVEPTACYNNAAVTPGRPVAYPQPVGLGDAACAALTASGAATFTRPGATYGPYRLGPDDRIGQPDFRWFATTNLKVASATLDLDFERVSVRSITSYVTDGTNQRGGSGTYVTTNRNANARFGDILITRGLDVSAACRDGCIAGAHIDTLQRRWGLTQELRATSPDRGRGLSWVAGVFYSNQRVKQEQYATITDEAALSVFGLTTAQRFGVTTFVTPDGAADGYTFLNNTFKDLELAAFGDVNLWLTRKLRATAGLRLSRLTASFHQVTYGAATGFLVPTLRNGGLASGETTDKAVTPKASLEFRISPDDMVYATAAKGFRPGGVNTPLPEQLCRPALAVYGLQPDAIPKSYESDAVWNYEVGGKLRLADRRLQVNAAAYHIDWDQVQLTTSAGAPCGVPFIVNSGQARVKGFELEAQLRLPAGLIADAAVGYNDARYRKDAVAIPANPADPHSTPLLAAVAGQRLPSPPLTVQVGVRYARRIGSVDAYLRPQWTYSRAARGSLADTFGTSAFAPDRRASNVSRFDLITGMTVGGADVRLFVRNLFNEHDGVVTGGRSICAGEAVGGTAACTSFATYIPDFRLTSAYQPRQIGLHVSYRY